MILRCLLPAGYAMLLAACSGSDPIKASDQVLIRDHELHALMAAQVDVLMARIQTLAFDQNRTVDELDQERRRQLRQLAGSAESLQVSAQGILQVLPRLALSVTDAEQFQSLAVQLESVAVQLESAARSGDLSVVSGSVALLQHTCVSCHQLYRGF